MLMFPHPHKDANKYTRGKLTIVAGSPAYSGAAILAAFAGSRCGAGYVRILTAPSNIDIVRISSPSFVVASWQELLDQQQSKNTDVSNKQTKPQSYVVGPGFDYRDTHCEGLLRSTLRKSAPVVIDGGAISKLTDPSMVKLLEQRNISGFASVITPHFGEASILAAFAHVDIQSQQAANELAKYYHSIVVLKGPKTTISNGVDSYIMDKGTSVLAKAGTGDILAGMIGAFLAQNMQPYSACISAATLHAQSGIVAQEKFGDICVMPEDIIESIPEALRRIEAENEME